jgi:hypothetical protein
MSGFEIRSLQNDALQSVVQRVGDAWESWTDEEKELVADCTRDAVIVGLIAASNVGLFKQEKAQIDAQLANIKVAAGATVAETIWKVVADVLSLAVSIILKAI